MKRFYTLAFRVLLFTFIQGLYAALAWSQSYVCAANNSDQLAIVQKTAKREQVAADYVVLFYDAKDHKTAWYDYLQNRGTLTPIARNGSFLPIVYTKEKVAVHVCGMHFGDSLTVSTNPVGVPEGGADFRGVAANTAPSLQSSADSLSGAGSTGGTVQPGNANFGTTPQTNPITITGITLATVTEKGGYTEASINVSPQALAIATRAYRKNAQDLQKVATLLLHGNIEGETMHPEEPLPGSIDYLQREADGLKKELEAIRNCHCDSFSSAALFDQYQTRVQSFIGELNGLNGNITNDALGPRAVTLEQNYMTIAGVRDKVAEIIKRRRSYRQTFSAMSDAKWGPRRRDCTGGEDTQEDS